MQAESAQQLRSLLQEAAAGSSQAETGILQDPLGAAQGGGQAIKHNVPLPEDAADILKTVGKLKALSPLYTYAIYHPILFLFRYLILPLPSLLLFVVLAILQTFAFILKSFLYPVYVALSFITFPARVAFRFLEALMPVWIFLGSAVFIGCTVGALAGFLLGGTTRHAIYKTVEVSLWPLRVIGWVEPSMTTPTTRTRRGTIDRKREEVEAEREDQFGARGGAKLEKFPLEASRRPSSAHGGKGRGKALASASDEDEFPSNRFEKGKGKQTFRDRQRWTNSGKRSVRSASSTDEEEPPEDEEVDPIPSLPNKGYPSRRGKNAHARSGWRKRHVQDVLS